MGSNVTASTSSLSSGRWELAAATVGHTVLFGGGAASSTRDADLSARVDVWNADTNVWSTASLSVPRTELAAASVGGEFAIFGGGLSSFSPYTESAAVDIYRYSTDEWSTAQLSVPRRLLSATAVGPLALFAGGISTSGDVSWSGVSTTVDVFDSRTTEWRSDIGCLSLARAIMAATSVRHYALFAGGTDESGTVSDRVDMYDTVSGRWSAARLGQRKNWLAAASVSDRYAVFAGGGFSSEPYNSGEIDVFDVDTLQWTSYVSGLTHPRGEVCGVTVATPTPLAVFIAGSGAGGLTDEVDVLDLSGPHSPTLPLRRTAVPLRLSMARYVGACAAVTDSAGRAYVLYAGGVASGFESRVDIFRFDADYALPSPVSIPGELRLNATVFNSTGPPVNHTCPSDESGGGGGGRSSTAEITGIVVAVGVVLVVGAAIVYRYRTSRQRPIAVPKVLPLPPPPPTTTASDTSASPQPSAPPLPPPQSVEMNDFRIAPPLVAAAPSQSLVLAADDPIQAKRVHAGAAAAAPVSPTPIVITIGPGPTDAQPPPNRNLPPPFDPTLYDFDGLND